MRDVRRFAVVLAGMCVLVATSLVASQGQRPMTLVDLLEVPSLSDPQLSPDGRHLLYVLSEADWGANGYSRHIWRVNVGGTGAVQMTVGGGEGSPCWSPDGTVIAFIARRGDAKGPQIYLMRSDGEEAQQLTDHQTSAPVEDVHYPRLSSLTWAPDGRSIYFLALDPKTSEEIAREDAKDDTYAFDENHKHQHLWKVSVGDRAEQRITGGDYSVLSYELSRDGTRIVFHRGPSPRYGYANESEIWMMDATGKKPLQLTRNTVPESPGCCSAEGATLSPDNSQVLFMAKTNEQFDYYYKSSLFLMPASGGRARMLLPDLPYEVQRARWSKSGDSIFFLANMGVRSELFQLELGTGKLRQLTDGQHTVRSWDLVVAANLHVFTINEPTNAGDVWLLPIAENAAPTQVTHIFDYLARDFILPRQEKVEWKGVDGVTVEGLLYYPLGYQKGQRYPFVVQSHGGMANSDQFGFGDWNTYPQVLAAKGYAVLKTNYRGSGGYGDSFQRDMMGKYFRNSHLDVMAGADHVIEMGIADPDRMVKMGWSAGGFMTNKIITFTDRFKAASSGAGMVNWISFYAQSDIRYFRTTWLGGSPWQKDAPIANFWEQSPLSAIANVKTPTLIWVGEEDVRCPAPQGVELYRALKSNGVPTHFYVAPREPHGFGELRHRLFKMNREIDWFEHYARQRDYTWEQAPDKSRKAR